jgi:phosphohistidine phosphatase
MKLYFLRHGKAEDRSEDLTDFSRRLTPEGAEEMERVARGLAKLVGGVDAILSSPLPRALKTAEIAGAGLGIDADKIVITEELASGAFELESLKRLLHGRADDERLLLVGHEPDFSSMVRYLTGARIEMKKAGVAFVETQHVVSGAGLLRWLLTPRCLVLAGGEE